MTCLTETNKQDDAALLFKTEQQGNYVKITSASELKWETCQSVTYWSWPGEPHNTRDTVVCPCFWTAAPPSAHQHHHSSQTPPRLVRCTAGMELMEQLSHLWTARSPLLQILQILFTTGAKDRWAAVNYSIAPWSTPRSVNMYKKIFFWQTWSPSLCVSSKVSYSTLTKCAV